MSQRVHAQLLPTALVALALLLAGAFQNCAKPLPDLIKDNPPPPAKDGTSKDLAAKNCKDALAAKPGLPSGTYWISPDGTLPFQVYCDMTTDGGGWLLMARNNQTTTFTNFDRPWADYKAGFGNLSSGSDWGWLGNDNIHILTANGTELRVSDNLAKHFYIDFSVGTEFTKYVMNVTETAESNDNGNFAYHAQMPFSTSDVDNDTWPNNCASYFQSGWWYGACYYMSFAGNNTGQVYWRDAAGNPEAVSWIEMWVR